MDIPDIDIYRDGGSIEFLIVDDPAAGLYWLDIDGSPRPLSRDGVRLAFGSSDEMRVLRAAREWLHRHCTPAVESILSQLGNAPLIHGEYPDELERLTQSVRHMRAVVCCLEERCAASGS